MSSSLLTALPLSKERLKNVFENTRHLDRLCTFLDIPRDKRTVSDAVEYYYQSTHPNKTRKMIFWLDYIGDTALADSVMDCAEPPPGMYVHTLGGLHTPLIVGSSQSSRDMWHYYTHSLVHGASLSSSVQSYQLMSTGTLGLSQVPHDAWRKAWMGFPLTVP